MELAELKEIRRDLHRIPELGFQEWKTQEYLLRFIHDIATDRVLIQTWKTGILVKVSGLNPKKKIGYRADIDGLPIEELTGSAFASTHEGKMHACGHDFHMTIALGALKYVIEHPIQDDVVFVFQPAEEGPGGAFPMMQSEEFQRWKPDCIFALHVAPEYSVGTIASKPGLLFANTSELYIDFIGKGGHAAFPHLTKDMAVAAGSFISQVQHVVSRSMDPQDSAVVTIGKMSSGHVQNAIAETARLEGTIRTLNPEAMTRIKQKLEKMAQGFEISHDCEIKLDYGSNYYQVYNDSDYVQLFKAVVEQSEFTYLGAKKAMTGEDFGFMLKEIPGFMFWLGVDSPYGLHNAKLSPKEEALGVGVKIVSQMLKTISSKEY
ncbi:N-acetyldiaminopimelate deacetylase [Ornithinibacillus massiliensis]|uniref:N-acetyldiaminopimelate deacetylase n=1 Tax=Ornithinibacillus massiliensis TaxID=1944633 RepID=A0ABS5MD04_9BACI|nr:N-acetyldiaminopimelate deacetylase [Ornithinibacillus massiliensis]MBS3680201.1 N-acetyldiaminopimelate deacetylase [Ornithinibacillus massiliensis]